MSSEINDTGGDLAEGVGDPAASESFWKEALNLDPERLAHYSTLKNVNDLLEEAKEAGVEELSLGELIALRKANAPMNLIDIRESEERTSGNKIRDAVHIPRGLLELAIMEKSQDPNGLIVLFCSNGIRSTLAAQTLAEMGYRNVKVLSGGFKRIRKTMRKSESE